MVTTVLDLRRIARRTTLGHIGLCRNALVEFLGAETTQDAEGLVSTIRARLSEGASCSTAMALDVGLIAGRTASSTRQHWDNEGDRAGNE